MQKPYNTQKGGLITGLVLLGIAILLLVVPPIVDADMFQWGFGVMFLGFFLFLCALVITFIFLKRYKMLNHVLLGEGVLAHWEYDDGNYREEVSKRFRETKQENRQKLFIIFFFFVLFTGIFSWYMSQTGDEDAVGLFFGIMVICVLIISAFAYGMPYVYRRQSLRSAPDAYIAKNGLFYGGQLLVWGNATSILDEVFIREDTKNIVFKIRYLTQLGWIRYQRYTIEIPIPKGQESKAKEIVEYFDT